MIKSHNSLIFRWDGVSRDYIHFQPHKKKKGWVLSPFSSNFKSFLCLMSSWFDWSKMPINSQHEMGKGSKKTWPCASSQLLVLHRATGGTPATLTREAKGTLCFKHSIYFLTDVQNFNLNFRTETANVSAALVERCTRWPKHLNIFDYCNFICIIDINNILAEQCNAITHGCCWRDA